MTSYFWISLLSLCWCNLIRIGHSAGEETQDDKLRFNAYQLSELNYLQRYAGCRSSYLQLDKNTNLHIPWFCVKNYECISSEHQQVPSSIFNRSVIQYLRDYSHYKHACNYWEFHDHTDKCCFAPDLVVLKDQIFSWEDIKYDGEELTFPDAFQSYVEELFELDLNKTLGEDLISRARDRFSKSRVCFIQPMDPTSDGFVQYVPYFCVKENECGTPPTQFVHPRLPDTLDLCRNNYLEDVQIFKLEDTPVTGMVCCNPLAIENKGAGVKPIPYLQFDKYWSFKVFGKDVKYIAGLRASVQCEVYSKHVCLEGNDLCPYRILNRPDTAYPMEAYHQAMVGYKTHRSMKFHCGGTIISREWIISAHECRIHEGYITNVALVGDYRSDMIDELYADELFTYIVKHQWQPEQPYYNKHSQPHERFERRPFNVILFQLWRPMTFSAFRRPACLGYFFNYTVAEWMKPGTGLFTGYGTTTKGGGWNATVKRHLMKITQPNKDKNCQRRFFDDRKDPAEIRMESHFCAKRLDDSDQEWYDEKYDVREPWGPCEFDAGGSINWLLTVPYCQFELLGVLLTNRKKCNDDNIWLFRNTKHLVKWIEHKIYKDDFFLPDLDLSWPSCDRNNWQYINATFLHRRNNAWYTARYKKNIKSS